MADLGFFLDTSYCFSLRVNYMEELSFSFSSITSFSKNVIVFMKNIVVVTIGTSCCSNGFFQSNLYKTTKNEASLKGLPRFPSIISTKKKNNDYF